MTSVKVLETFNDTELLKKYRLNHKGIMTTVDQVKYAVTLPANRNNSKNTGDQIHLVFALQG